MPIRGISTKTFVIRSGQLLIANCCFCPRVSPVLVAERQLRKMQGLSRNSVVVHGTGQSTEFRAISRKSLEASPLNGHNRRLLAIVGNRMTHSRTGHYRERVLVTRLIRKIQYQCGRTYSRSLRVNRNEKSPHGPWVIED